MLQSLDDPVARVLGILLAGVMEGTGIPWPGGVVLATAGVATAGGWIALCLPATLFSLGYCLGALLQYGLGRLAGSAVLQWLPIAWRSRLESLMNQYGHWAVLWLRPVAVGNYISLPAGMVSMPVPRFTLYTFLGIWPWSFAMLALGLLLGEQFVGLRSTVTRWSLSAVLVLTVAGLASAAWKLHKERQRAGQGE